MSCSVKGCKSKYKPGCGINLFQFPLNDENRLEKWVSIVGRPNWKPKRTSRLCSLHFSKSDIVQGMGYQRTYLRQHTVPKDCSSVVEKEEQTGIAISKLKEICNTENNSKSKSLNEISVSSESVAHDHNYSNDNICATVKSDRSSTFNIRKLYRSIQKEILHPDRKHKFIQINPKAYIRVPIPHGSTDSSSEEDTDLADTAQMVKKLSESLKRLRRQNKTLRQKLRRREKRNVSIKQMFDRLQQEKLINNNPLRLSKSCFESLRNFKKLN